MSMLRRLVVAQIVTVLAVSTLAAQEHPMPGERGMGPGRMNQGMSMPTPQMGMGQMGMSEGMMMGGHDPEMMRVAAYSPARLLEQTDRLGLTPAQAARLDVLARDVEAAGGRAKLDHDKHHGDLVKLFSQPAPDVAQVRTHALGVVQADRDEHVASLVAAAQAKALLTAEQRARVEGWTDAREMMQADMARRQATMQGERPEHSQH